MHADLVLPIWTEEIDWSEEFPAEYFQQDVSAATHVAIGWGDKGFYLETPTWADLKVSTAANALLLPSETCLHVSMIRGELSGEGVRSVTITAEQYRALVTFITKAFQRDAEGRAVQITGFAYHTNDAFFEAHGSYNCINTCNAWIGRALKSSGVRTPWLTPLPKTVFLYLPE